MRLKGVEVGRVLQVTPRIVSLTKMYPFGEDKTWALPYWNGQGA